MDVLASVPGQRAPPLQWEALLHFLCRLSDCAAMPPLCRQVFFDCITALGMVLGAFILLMIVVRLP